MSSLKAPRFWILVGTTIPGCPNRVTECVYKDQPHLKIIKKNPKKIQYKFFVLDSRDIKNFKNISKKYSGRKFWLINPLRNLQVI